MSATEPAAARARRLRATLDRIDDPLARQMLEAAIAALEEAAEEEQQSAEVERRLS